MTPDPISDNELCGKCRGLHGLKTECSLSFLSCLGPERSLLFMSAVVLEELYAGAHDPTSVKLLDKLYDVFVSANRLVVPHGRDWQKAGKIIAQLERKYGFEEKYLARIANDILIALCETVVAHT
jgi:predicted nucleic acid-binding protein